jgi:hypothetical protein
MNISLAKNKYVVTLWQITSTKHVTSMFMYKVNYNCISCVVSRDSSVGIATDYGLDDQ